MSRNASKALVGLAIGIVFLALIGWRLEWDKVYDVLAASRPLYLVPIFFVLLIHYALKGLRWRVLLSGNTSVKRLFAIRLTMVGFLMNNIFPARIGELGRPYLLSANQPEISFSFALATVVGDKLFDLVLVILFLLASSLLLPLPPYAATGIAFLSVVCSGIICVALLASRWEERERTLGEDASRLFKLLSSFGKHGGPVYRAVLSFAEGMSTVSSARRALVAMLYSVGSFAFLLSAVYMTMLMVNLEGDFATCMFVIGMIGIGFMIPSAPTNAGNFHFFAAQALLLSGTAEADVAFSFALISHISQVAVVTIAGAASLIGLDWRKLKGTLDRRV